MARYGKREERRTMGLGKRMMSAFLATVMCVSMVQVSVLADEPTSAQIDEQDVAQILQDRSGDHLYYVWDDSADGFAVQDHPHLHRRRRLPGVPGGPGAARHRLPAGQVILANY